MSVSRLIRGLSLAIPLTCAPLAHAQEASGPPPPAGTVSPTKPVPQVTPPPARTNPPKPASRGIFDDEARALYQQGKSAYSEGDYRTALALFARVYERTGHPALLFNMAQVHRVSGPEHCLAARRLYVEYLVQDSQPPNGKEVREYILELEPCATAAEAHARPAPPQKKQVPPRKEQPSPRTAQWLTFGGGAVALTGLGLFTAAKLRFAQAQEECPCEPSSLKTWDTLEQVSLGLMAAGTVGLASGGIWWWASVSPAPRDEAVWLGVNGSF